MVSEYLMRCYYFSFFKKETIISYNKLSVTNSKSERDVADGSRQIKAKLDQHEKEGEKCSITHSASRRLVTSFTDLSKLFIDCLRRADDTDFLPLISLRLLRFAVTTTFLRRLEL